MSLLGALTQSLDDGLGEGLGAQVTTQVTCSIASGDGAEDTRFDLVGVLKERHVAKHFE